MTNMLCQTLLTSSFQMLQLCIFRLEHLLICLLTKAEFVDIFKLISSVMFVLKRLKLILIKEWWEMTVCKGTTQRAICWEPNLQPYNIIVRDILSNTLIIQCYTLIKSHSSVIYHIRRLLKVESKYFRVKQYTFLFTRPQLFEGWTKLFTR